MATATPPDLHFDAPKPMSPFAGVLSYLVPGLGQIAQGRVAKGLLFMICIYVLFFYGLYLGSGTVTHNGETLRVSNVYLPAPEEPAPNRQLPVVFNSLYNRLQFLGQFWVGVAAWPAMLQYYQFDPRDPNKDHAYLKDYMREPNPIAVNLLTNAGDKRLELAWVYTVIAGVLNILVIYDAVAGPAFGADSSGKKE